MANKKSRHRKKILGRIIKQLRDINKSWLDYYFNEFTEIVKEINKIHSGENEKEDQKNERDCLG